MADPFLEALDRHKIPYRTSGPKSHRGWVNFKCPHCGKCPYMGRNLVSGVCCCWYCGTHRSAEVLHLLTGMELTECWEICGKRSALPLEPKIHKGALKIPFGVLPMTYHHRLYLQSRGFNVSELVRLWDLQGIGMLGGKLSWRIFIPIHKDGEVVSWTTRAIGDKQSRYLSASDEESDVEPATLLYGFDYVRSTACLVEGPADVWALGPGAISIFGTRLGSMQIQTISCIPTRYILFDREPDAQYRAHRWADELSIFPGRTSIIQLESSKDPADCLLTQEGRQELAQIRKVCFGWETQDVDLHGEAVHRGQL